MGLEAKAKTGFTVLAYENAPVMTALCEALQAECDGGEFVIYRHAFRWMRWTGDYRNGIVLSNCYEMFPLSQVLEFNGYESRYEFEHAAIVSDAQAEAV